MRRISSLPLGLLAAILTGALLLACSGAAAPGPLAPVAGRPIAGNGSEQDSGNSLDDSDGTSQAPGPQIDAALIVHTGSIQLEVADLRAAINQAAALISGLGGQVAESHEQNDGGSQTASVTYRIPAAKWTEALTGLRALGQKVLAEDTDAEDVTTQVIDLDARIANLRASETALQGIMARATTITDVLKVQGELTGVRGDIESMVAQRDHLADQAALGTLEVGFNVPVDRASIASSGWDLGREVDGAVAALVRVSQGLASLGVWLLIVVLPVLIPVLVIFYVALRIRRRFAARSATPTLTPPSV